MIKELHILPNDTNTTTTTRSIIYNPIGAGDTVTGVLLSSLIYSQFTISVPIAYGFGLSAGSASCCTLYGAEYAYNIQECIQKHILIRSWDIFTA